MTDIGESTPQDLSLPVHPLIAERWSPRAFDAHRVVERDKLLAVLEAARWAPSCYNDQPWRYIVGDRLRSPPIWQGLLETLAEVNRIWCQRAPLLIAAITDTRFEQSGEPNRWAPHDVGAASAYLCLEAVHQGLIAHQMGNFDADALRRRFGIPERYMPMSIIAIGYPGDPHLLDGWQRAAENATRQRRPLESFVFEGPWGEALHR